MIQPQTPINKKIHDTFEMNVLNFHVPNIFKIGNGSPYTHPHNIEFPRQLHRMIISPQKQLNRTLKSPLPQES